jgi:hypothetical protein
MSRLSIIVVIHVVLRVVLWKPEFTTKVPRPCGEDSFVRMYGAPFPAFPAWKTELHIREVLLVVESAGVSVRERLRCRDSGWGMRCLGLTA